MELETYTRVIDTIRPPVGKEFAVVEAEYVSYNGGRVSEYMPQYMTQEAYDELVSAGLDKQGVLYVITG